MMRIYFKIMKEFFGVAQNTTGHAEKFISGIGALIGIFLTMWISLHYLGLQGATLLVASMGASAVLLFSVPHGALSQPWALLGGHFISALIGVTCAQNISNPLIAAPLAVSLAIIAMHYCHCTHPPGGATAMTAVIGGAQVQAMGYQFVLTPVMLNAIIMLFAGVAVNYAFPWRRYPASFMKSREKSKEQQMPASNSLKHNDFKYALGELGTYVDVSEEDLNKIYQLAVKHASQLSFLPVKISTGLYYSNGELGDSLSVRKVIKLSDEGPDAVVTFRIVAGHEQVTVNTTSLADFNDWQQYEVILKEGVWHRIMTIDN